jgi:hypothetical protein
VALVASLGDIYITQQLQRKLFMEFERIKMGLILVVIVVDDDDDK